MSFFNDFPMDLIGLIHDLVVMEDPDLVIASQTFSRCHDRFHGFSTLDLWPLLQRQAQNFLIRDHGLPSYSIMARVFAHDFTLALYRAKQWEGTTERLECGFTKTIPTNPKEFYLCLKQGLINDWPAVYQTVTRLMYQSGNVGSVEVRRCFAEYGNSIQIAWYQKEFDDLIPESKRYIWDDDINAEITNINIGDILAAQAMRLANKHSNLISTIDRVDSVNKAQFVDFLNQAGVLSRIFRTAKQSYYRLNPIFFIPSDVHPQGLTELSPTMYQQPFQWGGFHQILLNYAQLLFHCSSNFNIIPLSTIYGGGRLFNPRASDQPLIIDDYIIKLTKDSEVVKIDPTGEFRLLFNQGNYPYHSVLTAVYGTIEGINLIEPVVLYPGHSYSVVTDCQFLYLRRVTLRSGEKLNHHQLRTIPCPISQWSLL